MLGPRVEGPGLGFRLQGIGFMGSPNASPLAGVVGRSMMGFSCEARKASNLSRICLYNIYLLRLRHPGPKP